MIQDEITTTDFSKFGYRERALAEELLKASREQGFPEDFNSDSVNIMMNTSSGNVFFTNEDCQVAMMNRDKLEVFYSCSECGNEGFKEEFNGKADCKGCKEIWMAEIINQGAKQ